jgi:hypothetical protein
LSLLQQKHITIDQRVDVTIIPQVERRFMYLINTVIEMMNEPAEYITLVRRRHTIHDLNEDASIMVRTGKKYMSPILIADDRIYKKTPYIIKWSFCFCP